MKRGRRAVVGLGVRLVDGLILLCVASVLSIGYPSPAHGAEQPGWKDVFHAGVAARVRGNIQLSIDLLGKARETAESNEARIRASAELGASLLQARRLNDAEDFLKRAYAGSSSLDRARIAVDLGNLAATRGERELARRYYDEAESLAGSDQNTRITAGLNRVRVAPDFDRLATLLALYQRIDGVTEPALRARLYLNVGSQAKRLAQQGLETAYRSFTEAYKLIPQLDLRLKLEALDAMAQLYEDQGRTREALILTESALGSAGSGAKASHVEDILVRLEWRKGRLSRLEGRIRDALAAYQNAATHLEAIRQDIPIESDEGRSSFQEILRPIFTSLADLTLASASELPEQERDGAYRKAIHAMELTKQSEMQDYLGDRCSVEAVRSDAKTEVSPRSAVLYPILLVDRLELLLQTEAGILRRTVKIGSAEVANLAGSLSRELPRYWSKDYFRAAQQLYDWILRPFEGELAKREIETLVVVPDGPLRLIPMGALHDGQRFAIERVAITTVTGMSMTSMQASGKSRVVALLAGLSEPGPVVAKLAAGSASPILEATVPGIISSAAPSDTLRIRSSRVRVHQRAAEMPRDEAARIAVLKESLTLPGVKDEITSIRALVPNVSILDQGFTLGRFGQEVQSGDYRILHIASHGVFGGNASSSYIMTYDELLSMNGLESLLKENKGDSNPIELLTLSACETAEGNDRAPLGISGAAIKAKARSVLGTLWPVGDQAARRVMERFYEGLAREKLTKAKALQAAQKDLLGNEPLSHPFFWAPFVLIGNWM
jgi:CHAT domain-containing protein